MREVLIFAGLIIGGVVALFPKSSEPPVAKVTEPLATKASAAPTAPARLSGPTELARAGDGHFYASVNIGAHAVTMLVDTGASVVALTKEDAQLAGIAWDRSQLATVAQGAGGAVQGVAVTIPLLRVGNREAHDVRAVVIPEGLPISLLGQTFLKDIEPVTIEKNRMILGG